VNTQRVAVSSIDLLDGFCLLQKNWVMGGSYFWDAPRLPRCAADGVFTGSNAWTSPIEVNRHFFAERWGKRMAVGKKVRAKGKIFLNGINVDRVADRKRVICLTIDRCLAHTVLGPSPKVFVEQVRWTQQVNSTANVGVEGRTTAHVTDVILCARGQNGATEKDGDVTRYHLTRPRSAMPSDGEAELK
jgi:hypothetical protein